MPSLQKLQQYKFRPQGVSKKYKLRHPECSEYKWYDRRPYTRDEPLNQKTMGRIFGRLHYLGSHAPNAVYAKWHKIEMQFLKKHVPSRGRSMRYEELFSAGRWL
jgi:hypothetical protein